MSLIHTDIILTHAEEELVNYCSCINKESIILKYDTQEQMDTNSVVY